MQHQAVDVDMSGANNQVCETVKDMFGCAETEADGMMASHREWSPWLAELRLFRKLGGVGCSRGVGACGSG